MLETLKASVMESNKALEENGLVVFTWGNVSGYDFERDLFVIKPSGVEYNRLTLDKMVVVDMEGNVVEGKLKPSSDMPTHLEIYKHFPKAGGVVHTHSPWATCWAQAGKDIPVLGTTHADYFYGDIPCTGKLTKEETNMDYEKNTGRLIVKTFKDKNPEKLPGVIVNGHGPFTWGKNSKKAVENSIVLEYVAMMAFRTTLINPKVDGLDQYLQDKHYFRKHGDNAYYGQES